MPEERSATMIGGVEAEIRSLAKDMTDLKVSMGRMEGRFEQMDKRLSSMETAIDKRLSNVETTVVEVRRDVRQVFYFVVGAILVPILIEVVKKFMQ